jgi:hypothetical protein
MFSSVPEVPLPEDRTPPDTGERRLVVAVLMDAVELARGERTHARARQPYPTHEVRAARGWIERGNVGVISFELCCQALDLDVDAVRRDLRRRRKGGREKKRAALPPCEATAIGGRKEQAER